MNRAVMSARADRNPSIGPSINHGSSLLKPAPSMGRAAFVGRQRKAAKQTKAQRNSLGRMSEWAMPMTAPYGGWQ